MSGRNEPGDVGLQLPAVRSFDAMLHRQHSAFLRAQVVFRVGVAGRENVLGRIFLNLGNHVRDYRLCLFRSKSSVDEVLLHVDDDQYFSHIHEYSLSCKIRQIFPIDPMSVWVVLVSIIPKFCIIWRLEYSLPFCGPSWNLHYSLLFSALPAPVPLYLRLR